MKKVVLLTIILISSIQLKAQIINDNKVSFSYIQLPVILIDKPFTKYEVRINHAYLDANKDSIAIYESKKSAAATNFEIARVQYQKTRDSLERVYFKSMAIWEVQMNEGKAMPNGLPYPKPNPPIFPEPPIYTNVLAPRMHAEYDENSVKSAMKIEGFEQGLGGSILSINLLPIRNISIVERKKGTGPSTKYEYNCEYVLPIEIKFETPTQGVVLERVIFEGKQSYGMKDQKSQYDHQIFMLDNADKFYSDLELYARRKAISEASEYLNDQLGFVTKKRNTEIYSVKKYKDYDYSDVTNAYSTTVQAMSLISKERNCASAQSKLEDAMKQWNEIMIESNTYDNKARINDKISAMIQCNMAEIQLWQSKFGEANATLNLAMNAGVLKAKIHGNNMTSFYAERQRRWELNY